VEVGVPDIKLDFSRVAYSNVLEIIAPIVPGGILAVGTLVLNPSLAAGLLSNPYLGYRSRLAAAIFISYAAGLLLNLLVNYTSYFLGYIIGSLWGSKLFPDPPTPWKNLHWRKMARRFLGPDLAPATDDLYLKELHEQKLREANAIQDAEQRAFQLKFVEEFFLPKSMADSDWYWWYQVLGKYFASPQLWAAPWQYFLSMVHTASWAVILLMVLNHHHHWFAWIVCITGVFFGNGSSWFSGGARSDPYAVDQTAMLFRALKPLSEVDTKSEKEPAA
jgi:hypothetical protein